MTVFRFVKRTIDEVVQQWIAFIVPCGVPNPLFSD